MRSDINKRLRFVEFIVAGVLVHLVVIALFFRLIVGRSLSLVESVLAVLLIVPFAALTEYVIDRPRFWHRLLRLQGHKFDDLEDL